jgi:phosphatidylglycerol:prolipoprotein diacylglycerol transferase
LRWRIKKGEAININSRHSRPAKREESSTLNKKNILDFIFYSAIGLLLGARLFFVFFYGWEYFSQHLWEIFVPYNFSSGQLSGIYGMSYHGGLIGIIIATIIFCRKNKIDFWKFSDFAIPAIPAGFFFGRLGNFLNGELYGRITEKWWGMHFDSSIILRHPSQLYEALGEGVLLFVIFWLLRNNKKISGQFLIFYLIAYGIIRFIIEFFRQPDPQVGLILNFLTLGQALCIAMILSAGGIFIAKKRFF